MAGISNGLFAARAGIASNGLAISVLADNITNGNTTGFKASRADFADVLSSSIGGGSGSNVQVGQGSQVQSVTQIFNQGAFELTGRGLDLAIEGNGFFIVDDAGERFYTRAGNLRVDTDGNVLDQNGFQVLGFPADGSGGLEALNVNSVSQTAEETADVAIAGNLNADATITAVPGGTPSFAQLAAASSFSTFVDVFDTLGAKHTVTVYFFKTAAATWQARAYVDAGEVGGTAGDASAIGNATFTFTSSGARTTPLPTEDFSATAAWSNGASATAAIDFLFSPMTQFAAPSAVNSITQNGTGVGNILSFSVGSDGTLFASLDNGQSTSVGTVALANFANPEGLGRSGNSLYSATTASGDAIVGTPETGRFGTIQAGALELSTADIADDFVKLITLQRGFQGSSRLIGTINDLLSEIVNLTR